ncbi:hypothetical protein N9948_01640 [bacterium]|nr:hypothetical protein [bacterium]
MAKLNKRKKGYTDMRQAKKFMYDRVKYSNDEQFLKIVAMKNPYTDLKELAIPKIHDQKFLYEFILKTKSSWLRQRAARNITETFIKKKILNNLNNFDESLFMTFLEEIKDDQELLYRCLRHCTEPRIFKEAIPYFKKRKLLIKLKKDIEKGIKAKELPWGIKRIFESIDERFEEIPASMDFILD